LFTSNVVTVADCGEMFHILARQDCKLEGIKSVKQNATMNKPTVNLLKFSRNYSGVLRTNYTLHGGRGGGHGVKIHSLCVSDAAV